MDLKITNTGIEINHGTKEEIIEVLDKVGKVIDLNSIVPTHLESVLPEVTLDAPVTDLHKSLNNELFKLEEDAKEVIDFTHVESPLKKKLLFVKCPECGETFCVMKEVEDDLAPHIYCKCGHGFFAHHLKKGSYECKCGQKGFFLMTPEVENVKCKECGDLQYMILDSLKDEYVNLNTF